MLSAFLNSLASYSSSFRRYQENLPQNGFKSGGFWLAESDSN